MMQTFTIGRLFDIRVGVHVSWIAVYLFMTISLAGVFDALPYPAALGLGALCALVLFASVIVHEFAHALVARAFDVRTRAITLFLFGGVATLEREPPSPRAEALIALAGPLASALIAALAFGVLVVLEHIAGGRLVGALRVAATVLAVANGVLAVFNLIPAFPMDGGRVLRAAIWHWRKSRSAATAAASLAGLVFAGLMIVGGGVLAVWLPVWQYGWYVLLGAFLFRQGWSAYHDARLTQRLERIRVCDVMDEPALSDLEFEGFHLAPSATGLDAVAAFRDSDRTMIPVVADGRLSGWITRARTLALLKNVA
jgi:Zn-dependent protease